MVAFCTIAAMSDPTDGPGSMRNSEKDKFLAENYKQQVEWFITGKKGIRPGSSFKYTLVYL